MKKLFLSFFCLQRLLCQMPGRWSLTVSVEMLPTWIHQQDR